jgi:lipopolysaccharide biosynthesis regulator YciM
MLQITSNPLVQVVEAMMENRQDQISDEGFLMTKKRRQKSKERPKYRNSLCGYSVHKLHISQQMFFGIPDGGA